MKDEMRLFTGNAHPDLAQAIARELDRPLGHATVSTFKDGETRVRLEDDVRGRDVFIIQPTCYPVNHHLMELLIMIDAACRASAQRITAVMPYYGYAKQEKKTVGREPISARLVANLIQTAGANRVLTLDLHTAAIEGFFDIPVDHLRAAPILADHFRRLGLEDVVVVSPDAGGVTRANAFRGRLGLGADLAIVFKHRPTPEETEVLELVGHVAGKTAIIVDDMIQSGGTLVQAARVVKEYGATRIYVAVTHPVFAPNVMDTLEGAPIEYIVVTDSIPLRDDSLLDKVAVQSVAWLLAQAIHRIHENLSVSELFS